MLGALTFWKLQFGKQNYQSQWPQPQQRPQKQFFCEWVTSWEQRKASAQALERSLLEGEATHLLGSQKHASNRYLSTRTKVIMALEVNSESMLEIDKWEKHGATIPELISVQLT